MYKKVSFILPTLNERKGLEKTLPRIPVDKLSSMDHEVEVIISDGGSTDGTTDIERESYMQMVTEKGGYGVGVINGLKYANGDVIIVSDADDTYPLEYSDKFLKIMKEKNIDYLITDRLSNGEREAFPSPHLVGNKLLNLLFFFIFGCRFSDSQSGLLIFKKSLVDESKLPLFGDHFSFNSALKYHLLKRSQNPAKIPIPYRRRISGQTKQQWYKTGSEILFDWLKTRFLLFLSSKEISLPFD